MDLNRKDVRARVARRMAEIRREHGRSQAECAEALGIGQPSYSDMEAGQLKIRRRDLVTLAVFYGLSLDEAFPTDADALRAA